MADAPEVVPESLLPSRLESERRIEHDAPEVVQQDSSTNEKRVDYSAEKHALDSEISPQTEIESPKLIVDNEGDGSHPGLNNGEVTQARPLNAESQSEPNTALRQTSTEDDWHFGFWDCNPFGLCMNP